MARRSLHHIACHVNTYLRLTLLVLFENAWVLSAERFELSFELNKLILNSVRVGDARLLEQGLKKEDEAGSRILVLFKACCYSEG